MAAVGEYRLFRGALLDLVSDPFFANAEETAARFIADGLLVVSAETGQIVGCGEYSALQDVYSAYLGQVLDYRAEEQSDGSTPLLIPGMIDMHIHYGQTEMIGSYGQQLLDWLQMYTFPAEGKFASKEHSQSIASIFLDQLLSVGTTSAVVMTTVFPQSVDALFEEAEKRQMRIIAGKVMMDRNAPEYLVDTPETSYAESKDLIERWHKKGRLLYAVTPRFAITSTPQQLEMAGRLVREYPDVYVHTHVSENKAEVAFVGELFPESAGYLDVYDQRGLVRERSIYAHGVHLTQPELQRLSDTGASIAFCPTSNLFLGSGLFNVHAAKSPDCPVKVGLGTDVGGGTSFSLLTTAQEAYKVTQLLGKSLSPIKSLFLATLGAAQSLSLDHCLGNFEPGKEADFVVVDLTCTQLLQLRAAGSKLDTLAQVANAFFGLQTLAPSNAVIATYVLGRRAFTRKQ